MYSAAQDVRMGTYGAAPRGPPDGSTMGSDSQAPSVGVYGSDSGGVYQQLQAGSSDGQQYQAGLGGAPIPEADGMYGQLQQRSDLEDDNRIYGGESVQQPGMYPDPNAMQGYVGQTNSQW